ncbi:hypothetical protein [Pendulispora albinea]|uniref:Uncharacterized protein n=1 Tax=Pendulispora albinea TaxID=2741071 RepID=A0ABZ2LTG9_9BACT
MGNLGSRAADTSHASPYRDVCSLLRRRRDELIDGWQRSLGAADDLASIYARRHARAVAGCVAIFGAAIMILRAVLRSVEAFADSSFASVRLTQILIATLAAIAPAYFMTRVLAKAHFAHVLGELYVATDDVRRDLEDLESGKPRDLAVALVDGLEYRSVALPLIGWSLVAPLSIHLAIAAPFAGSNFFEAFDVWIGLSMVIVGLAHIVLVALSWCFAKNLRAWSSDSEETLPDGWSVLGWTVGIGSIPGAVLLFVPTILIAITGVAFIPWVFDRMQARVLDERKRLRFIASHVTCPTDE